MVNIHGDYVLILSLPSSFPQYSAHPVSRHFEVAFYVVIATSILGL